MPEDGSNPVKFGLLFYDVVTSHFIAEDRASVDAPGEWYWTSNLLTAYSPSGNPASQFDSIKVTSRAYAIRVAGQEYLDFDGLHGTRVQPTTQPALTCGHDAS